MQRRRGFSWDRKFAFRPASDYLSFMDVDARNIRKTAGTEISREESLALSRSLAAADQSLRDSGKALERAKGLLERMETRTGEARTERARPG